MRDAPTAATREADAAAIEINLAKLQQLFNSFDPSPFHEKDLDRDAEEYIVGSVDDFPLPIPLKLVIRLPPEELATAGTHDLRGAVHNYFAYRREEQRRRVRSLFRQGRISLVIGFVFLFACMSVRELAVTLGGAAVTRILAESLLIVGWVAMWRPLEIFLYDWWPLRHRVHLYAKLAQMPVEVRAALAPP